MQCRTRDDSQASTPGAIIEMERVVNAGRCEGRGNRRGVLLGSVRALAVRRRHGVRCITLQSDSSADE